MESRSSEETKLATFSDFVQQFIVRGTSSSVMDVVKPALASFNVGMSIDAINLTAMFNEAAIYARFLQKFAGSTPGEINLAIENKLESLRAGFSSDDEEEMAIFSLPLLTLIEFSKYKKLRADFLAKYAISSKDDSEVINLAGTDFFQDDLTLQDLELLASYFENMASLQASSANQEPVFPFLGVDDFPENIKNELQTARMSVANIRSDILLNLVTELDKIKIVKVTSLENLTQQLDYDGQSIYEVDQAIVLQLKAAVEELQSRVAAVKTLLNTANESRSVMVKALQEIKDLTLNIVVSNKHLMKINAMTAANSALRTKLSDIVKSVGKQLQKLGVSCLDPDLYLTHPDNLASALCDADIASMGQAIDAGTLSIKLNIITSDLGASSNELLRQANTQTARMRLFTPLAEGAGDNVSAGEAMTFNPK